MMIPQPNISAYRKQFSAPNDTSQLIPTLCNEDIYNQRMIGGQYALISGIYDEGASFRGYGCNTSNGSCAGCNVYCPIYYNVKSSYQGNNGWFI